MTAGGAYVVRVVCTYHHYPRVIRRESDEDYLDGDHDTNIALLCQPNLCTIAKNSVLDSSTLSLHVPN